MSRAKQSVTKKVSKPARPIPVQASYNGVMVTTRLSPQDLARVDAIAAAIAKGDPSNPWMYGGGRPQNRSTAFRTLLHAGLAALEPTYGIKPTVTK